MREALKTKMETIAATAQPSAVAEPNKKKRVRSPAYPAESLPAAVQRVKKLYDADHESGSTLESAAQHMGFNKAHGDALSVLAG